MQAIQGLFTLACAATVSALALVLPGAAVQETPPQMPQPTEHHKQILAGVGEWEGTVTTFKDGVAEAPIAAHETVVGIGGFWTQSTFKCDFMGQPYHGTGVFGYDATKRRFVGTWADSMSSHLAVMEGQMDPKTKTVVMRWEGPDMTGATVPHRYEAVHNPDSYTSTFFAGPGDGTKTMVIEMKRKAGAAAGR